MFDEREMHTFIPFVGLLNLSSKNAKIELQCFSFVLLKIAQLQNRRSPKLQFTSTNN